MTTLQIAQKTIKDLKTIIANLHAKYKDGFEALQQTIAMLQKEIQRLLTENKQLSEAFRLAQKWEKLAALVPALEITIKDLKKQLTTKENENEKIAERLAALRDNIKKTSETSDKPSSTNIFKKPVSTKVKSGKKQGGQPGHKGHTLRLFPNPVKIIEQRPEDRCACGGPVRLHDGHTSKQVVDIEITLRITEERVFSGYCEKCGKRHDGAFSKGYVNPVNYGNNFKALVAFLNTRMNLPVNKISELFRVLTDSQICLSDGSVVNIVADLANKSAPTVNLIKEELIQCGLLLADETGCRINGSLEWFQILTNDRFLLLSHNEKRGSLLFEDTDILILFSGILLHDHFKSYYRYEHLLHAECNEHIDRRLKAIHEILQHEWARELRTFFFDADKRKKELMDKGEYFSDQEKEAYFRRFLEILDDGETEYQKAIEGKRIIIRYNEERCLLKRLREYANEHLRYITHPEVPRGNNGAERGAKEAKRKVRVSGGFRSDSGADNYARVTSIIDTMRKNDMNVFQGIKDILNGETLDFQFQSG
jgi:transposase